MAEQRTNRARSKNIFGDELEVLKESREFLKSENISIEEYKSHLESFQKSYDELLDQVKLITKVSDRLQNKINKANDDLEFKNIELQESLDALTKAKLSRKANTITLIVVFALFFITEAFVEPEIDDFAHSYFENSKFGEIALSLLAKAVIALSLRPIEKLVEKRLLKKEQEKFHANKLERRSDLEVESY